MVKKVHKLASNITLSTPCPRCHTTRKFKRNAKRQWVCSKCHSKLPSRYAKSYRNRQKRRYVGIGWGFMSDAEKKSVVRDIRKFVRIHPEDVPPNMEIIACKRGGKENHQRKKWWKIW